MYSRKLGGLPEVPSITTVISRHAADLTGWSAHMAATARASEVKVAVRIVVEGWLGAGLVWLGGSSGWTELSVLV